MKESISGDLRQCDVDRMRDGWRAFEEEFYYYFMSLSQSGSSEEFFSSSVEGMLCAFGVTVGNQCGIWELFPKFSFVCKEVGSENNNV